MKIKMKKLKKTKKKKLKKWIINVFYKNKYDIF